MGAKVSARVLLSNKSLQNNGTLCCAASDAFCVCLRNHAHHSRASRLVTTFHKKIRVDHPVHLSMLHDSTSENEGACVFQWQPIPAFRTSRPSSQRERRQRCL